MTGNLLKKSDKGKYIVEMSLSSHSLIGRYFDDDLIKSVNVL